MHYHQTNNGDVYIYGTEMTAAWSAVTGGFQGGMFLCPSAGHSDAELPRCTTGPGDPMLAFQIGVMKDSYAAVMCTTIPREVEVDEETGEEEVSGGPVPYTGYTDESGKWIGQWTKIFNCSAKIEGTIDFAITEESPPAQLVALAETDIANGGDGEAVIYENSYTNGEDIMAMFSRLFLGMMFPSPIPMGQFADNDFGFEGFSRRSAGAVPRSWTRWRRLPRDVRITGTDIYVSTRRHCCCHDNETALSSRRRVHGTVHRQRGRTGTTGIWRCPEARAHGRRPGLSKSSGSTTAAASSWLRTHSPTCTPSSTRRSTDTSRPTRWARTRRAATTARMTAPATATQPTPRRPSSTSCASTRTASSRTRSCRRRRT